MSQMINKLMKHSFSRDIKWTLIIKFLLLTLLWFFCFKGGEKPSKDPQRWLLGDLVSTTSMQVGR